MWGGGVAELGGQGTADPNYILLVECWQLFLRFAIKTCHSSIRFKGFRHRQLSQRVSDYF